MKTVFILISMLFPVAVMAQKSVKISDDISITQLSDKVYTYVSLAEIEGWGMVPSNGMIVINNYQAALLDTPINDAQTETLVNWVADSLHAKVTTFIPNHWHGDCIGGLGYLQKKGVQSYANQMTIDLAKEKGLPVPDTNLNCNCVSRWLKMNDKGVAVAFVPEAWAVIITSSVPSAANVTLFPASVPAG
jgi:metallo-beta-lactamase class B